MMEQGKSMDVKTLKARFQGENNFRIQSKPLIPEKPQTIPPSPTKVSNPLVSSINSAVKKGTFHAPRVVFKDHQLPSPMGLKGNEEQPVSISELQDSSHENEGNVVRRPIKDRNLPLVLPVPPIKAKTPELEPGPLTPVSVSPAKVSTPKKFVFNTTTTGKDNKADTVKNITPSAEPSPLTPLSVSPAKVSTPKRFVFNTPNAGKDVKADTVEIPTPTIHTPDLTVSSLQPPTNSSITANYPSASVPVVPKALVPQISAGERSIASIPASSIPASGIPTFASPKLKVPELAIPTPAIHTQPVHKSETSKTETPVSAFSDATSSKPNIHLLSLSEVFPPPKESPPPDFTDIPPPVIPDFLNEDHCDGDIPSSAIHASIPSVSRSPALSRTPSPSLASRSAVSPELLLRPLQNRSRPSSVTAPSPTPSIEEVLEHSKTRNDKTEVTNENQSPARSPLLALARAEEMAPVKRTNPLDNRVLNLLEKAKRKTPVTQLASTAPFKMDAPKVALPDTDLAQCDPEPHERVLPQVPTTVETLPEETSTMPEELSPDLHAFPPVDYADHTRVPKAHPPKTVQVNGLNYSQTSPGILKVVKPVNPPPPPPRKPLPATPTVAPPLEIRKPSPQHPQIPTAAEHLETYEDQPFDNSFEEPSFEDSEEFEAPAVPNFRPVPPLASGSARTTSVHDEAFLKQWNPKHHTAEDMLPNTEGRSYGEVDYASVNASSPQPGAQAFVPPDQVRSSPVSRDVLSPSRTLEKSGNVYEDPIVNKKGKTAKNKKQKGPLKNPYFDGTAVMEETPKKVLFSRKNSEKAVDEKELKKKEKQREKDKEKEKERERKEQKEKEKKEHEIKKKFKITGQDKAIYQVRVIEDCKGGKNDLLVNAGETVNIIRTTNCPKGKWLAKDSGNRYGYVPVENMDLNINGIMELGKKTTASNNINGNGLRDGQHTSTGSRTSDHYAMNHESFSDDSEEWTCDDDDPAYGSPSETAHIGLNQKLATPATVSVSGPVHQTQMDGNYTNVQAKHEALQKLSTFFTQPKPPSQLRPINNTPVMEMPKQENPGNLNEEEEDLDVPVFKVLPPPDLYADIIAGDSMPIYSKPIKTTK